MPDLPTLTIADQAIYDRIVAAFESDPVRYRAWLKAALKEYVTQYEIGQMKQQAVEEWAARREEINNMLPDA